jgi:outer membrane protein assembly factor BamB
VGGDGFLYCVQTETGRVNWRYDLRTWVASRPTLSGGRLFVTTADDVVYAFDAGTGKWLWHYRRRTSQSSAIHGASAPAVDKGEVLVGLSDGYLIALGVDDGSLKWERRLGLTQKFTDLDASPIVQGNEIYIPSYDGAFYTLRREGGEVLWKFDAGGARTVRLSADSIWLSSSNGTLYRLSRQSGKVLYEFELDKPAPTSVALTDDYVILGSTYQYLYVLDRESGEVVYRFNAGDGSGFASDPVLDPERRAFYILSQGGNLYQFFLRDLKHLQKVSPSAPLDPYGFQDRNFVRKSSRASSKASSESLSQSR